MTSGKAQLLGLCVLALCTIAAIMAAMFSQTEIVAQTESPQNETGAMPLEPEQIPELPVEPEPQTEPSVDATQISAVEQAHDQLRAGKVWDGAMTLLAALRAMPDTPQTLDEFLPAMQMLSFSMCFLMRDDDVYSLLQTLDPDVSPLDELILNHLYGEFTEFAEGRNLPYLTVSDLQVSVSGARERLRELGASSSPLVRAWATISQAGLHNWDLSGNNEQNPVIDVMNQIASECPDCRITHELFREMAFRSLMPMWAGQEAASPETIDSLLATADWNDTMSRIVSEDPIVQVVQTTLVSSEVPAAKTAVTASTTIVDTARDVAETAAAPESRDWAVRQLCAALRQPDLGTESRDDVLATLDTVAAMLAEDQGLPAGKTGLDAARAQLALLGEAIKAGRDDDALGYVDLLLNKTRDAEPVEINLHIHIASQINLFTDHLINTDKYCEAIAVLQRLVDAYPNSNLADRCQSKIDNLKGLCR